MDWFDESAAQAIVMITRNGEVGRPRLALAREQLETLQGTVVLVLKRFSFFEIEESLKIAILAPSRYRKWRKIVHFLFAPQDQRENIYQCTLDML